MIRATLYLPRYDWTIYAYVAVHRYYRDEILDRMIELGADEQTLVRANTNLSSGTLNNGLTFSNGRMRSTVWVVELTSSAGEFFNSVVHEIRHLQQHIANEFGIDENSEEACYLCGDIALKLFPYCKKMLCEHCRGH